MQTVASMGRLFREVSDAANGGVLLEKVLLETSQKFTGKQLCQGLFLNKVVGPRPATLLKKRHWHICFSVNFSKFLTTPFLQNTCGRLLLQFSKCKAHDIHHA